MTVREQIRSAPESTAGRVSASASGVGRAPSAGVPDAGRPRALRVLLVDDEAGFREMAAEHLESVGMEVEQAAGGAAALRILRTRTFDIAVFDLKMPDMSGLDLLARVKADMPEMEILILTAHSSVETAVEAIRLGAHHYLLKPIKLSELQVALERAAEKSALNRLRDGQTALREHRKHYRHGEFLAFGPKSKSILETAAQAASGSFPVLIEGETGTGKELIAQFLHRHSARSNGPLVAVNCGLLSDSLLERELFGHSKGAFTGAAESRAGLFEAADGGTLFLDEIGESSPNAQVALLRAIETGMFRRIGETRERFADVRVVAASNRPLSKSVGSAPRPPESAAPQVPASPTPAGEGAFRSDLYHRLNVVGLTIPPLRDRPDEIVPLACAFLARLRSGLEFSNGAETAMTAYPWPGNVRELQNAIERAVLFRTNASSREETDLVITAELLGLPAGPSSAAAKIMDLDAAERAHVLATMGRTNGDKRAAAKALGITLRHLYRKIKKYDLVDVKTKSEI